MTKDGVSLAFLLFCAVLGNIFAHAHGLYCLSCDETGHARDCREVVQCGASSVCFNDMIVQSTGRIYHRLGCRDNTTKPLVKQGETTLCSETCASDLCSVSLCNDPDFQQPRGPICFSCDQTQISDCSRITICGRDEICHDAVKVSGCYSSRLCHKVASTLGRKRSACFNCCDTDLCNAHNCSSGGSNLVTHSPPTTTHSVQQPCIDVTTADICKLASGVGICDSRDKAHNAGCLHFCGFC